MSGPISGVLAAISQRVVTELARVGHAPLIDGDIPVGPEHLVEQLAPPRIVIDPQGGDFAGRADAGDVAGQSTTLPPLASQKYQVDVYVWGIDYDDVSYLTDAFVRAVANTLTTGGFVITQQRPVGKTRIAIYGRCMVCRLSWTRTITRVAEPFPQALVTSQGGTAILDPRTNGPDANWS